MLYFIGLGLWDENSMTLEALDTAKSCDVLFAELYTSNPLGTTVEKLEEKFGKKIEVLGREEVEQSSKIVDEAANKNVAFLVGGDVMTATTHVDLLIQARKKEIETKVIHAPSIYSAAAASSGLQIYKFGKTGSIVTPEEGFEPETAYDIVKQNGDAHTLLLVDIKPDKFMTANEAMQVMLDIESKRKENVFTEETKVVVVARVGSEDELVKYGTVKELIKEDFSGPMHSIIVPGKLHFKEEEALELWE